LKSWRTSIAGVVLVAWSASHSLWPQHVALDWPSVSLLAAGLLLLFADKLSAMLPHIKRVRIGEAEIELQQKLSGLTAEVRQLEVTREGRAKVDRLADVTTESAILDLAARGAAAALVRLGIEIEREMLLRCRELGVDLGRPTWPEMIHALTDKKVLSGALGRALIEFRDVRNQVIHAGVRGPVQKEMLTRTIDSGLRLLRLLKAADGPVGAEGA
jgi:hypothetical protein